MARVMGVGLAVVCLGGVLYAPGTGGRPEVPRPTPPSFFPHQPFGYLEAARFTFGASPGDTWKPSVRAGVTQTQVNDATAPISPPKVLEVSFPVGWKDDPGLPLLRFRQMFGGGSRSVYLSLAFKVGAGWRGTSSGIENIITFRPPSGAGDGVGVVFMEAKPSKITPKLRLRGLDQRYSGSKSPWLVPNLAPGVTLSEDTWYRFELLLELNTPEMEDGSVQWWVDGDPMGSYAGIGFWDESDEGVWGAEWRVAGPAKKNLSQQQTIWLDDAYIGLAAGGDRVVLRNDASADTEANAAGETVVAVDARTRDNNGVERCLNDGLHRSGFAFDNLLPSGSCPPWSLTEPFADELVVFSPDDPVALHRGDPPPGIWTAAAGDWPSIPLGGEPVEVPLELWLVSAGAELDCPDPAPVAECDVLTANWLYHANRTGIRFEVMETHDVSTSTDARSKIGSYCDAGVEKTTYFVAGRMNIYYVPVVANSYSGVWCPLAPNVAYVSTDLRLNTTLAHELGHAFSLQDVASGGMSFYFKPNGTPRFSDQNLMWQGGSARSSVSVGQAYRMSLESLSMLNRGGWRTGFSRQCECHFTGGGRACINDPQFLIESDIDAVCPRISREWTP